MTYEKEYLPRDEELEDVVRVLKVGASEAVDVPDDDEEPTNEEGAPRGATSEKRFEKSPSVAATAEQEQPTNEED